MNKKNKDYISILKGESKKDRFTLWVTKSVVSRFKLICGDIAPSRVIESFMKDQIEDYDNKETETKEILRFNDIDDLGLTPQNLNKLVNIKDKNVLNQVIESTLESIIEEEKYDSLDTRDTESGNKKA